MTRTAGMKTETIQSRIKYHESQARFASGADEDDLAGWHEQQAQLFASKLKERKIEDLKSQIIGLENLITRKEMSDNYFYTSGRKDRFEDQLRDLKAQLAELEAS